MFKRVFISLSAQYSVKIWSRMLIITFLLLSCTSLLDGEFCDEQTFESVSPRNLCTTLASRNLRLSIFCLHLTAIIEARAKIIIML